MYGRPMGPGIVGGGVGLSVTGFYAGTAMIVALVLVVLGAALVRVSYMKRRAADDR